MYARRTLLELLIPIAILACSRDDLIGPAPDEAETPDGGAIQGLDLAAANGRIAFVSDREGNEEIYVMNADGSGQTNLTHHPEQDKDPAFSPDGSKIAFTSARNGSWDIYVMNANGSNVVQLTNHPALDWNPSWSPDGSRLVFTSYRAGGGEIFTMRADGSNVVQLTDNAVYDRDPAWSPTGALIAFETYRGGNWEIFTMKPDGSNQTPVANHPRYDFEPTWSPDGTRLAWRTGRWDGIGDIAVIALGSSVVTNLTNDPAYDLQPSWSPDGTKIAYAHVTNDELDVMAMNTDGTGKTNLTRRTGNEYSPSWGSGGGGGGTALLTVQRAGTGQGKVTSAPSGINCGSDCTQNYAVGTVVKLTATAGQGSTFVRWSGACSGSGSCTVTMNAARTVTATFTGS